MKVTTETLPERQLKLQIEIDDERHAEALEQAYKRLAPRVRIRGFRPGKAPRPMIEKEIGRHRLLDEAMDIVVPEAYRAAIEQESIVPVASPSVELVSHEPLVFTATVPLQPVVELGDYKSISVPREPVTTTEEQVEASLIELRRRSGTIEPVDRPAAKGDVIRGNVKAIAEDDISLINQDEIEFRVLDDTLASLPGLADMLVGMNKGGTLEQSAVAPEDYPDERLRGKTINYTVAVHDVKEERLAEADDAFAKEVGEEFETIEALRQRIRADLQTAAEAANLRAYESACLDALVANASVEFAAVMIDHEVEHLLQEQANIDPRDPRAIDIYIQRLGKSEAEVKESVRPEAETRLTRSLVLSDFADKEGIAVEDADVDAEIETMASQAGEQADMVRQIFNTEQGRDNLTRTLLTRKTFARLVELAGGAGGATSETREAPSDTEAAAKKPARSRRSKPKTTE